MYKYTALPIGIDEPTPYQSSKSVPSDTWLLWGCHIAVTCLSATFLLITFPLSAWCFIKNIPAYQRVVLFRLGRVRPTKGPGLIVLLPLIDQWQPVDMRTRAFKVPPCKVKSRDGALVSLGADIQYRVSDPVLSVMSVQDLDLVIRSTSQNLLKQSLGRKYLREIHSKKASIGEQLKEDINEQVKPWGVNVERVHLVLESVLQAPEDQLIETLTSRSNTGFEHLLTQFVSLVNQSSGKRNPPSLADAFTDISLQHLLSQLEERLSESLVSNVKASYQMYITLQDGERVAYYLNLTSGSGCCGWGVLPFPSDVTIETTELDLLSLFRGNLHPITAYKEGRMRVIGDLQTALRLENVLRVFQQ
ncbi:stomatin-like protein 1 [Bombina bombina]|uniref:stomatin-like protein 1 n=1 Tax=Bombina bombina TaxID=8345 RepID=UPI00235A6AC5|nr:stomatin-like protein 1 [Bombina bombina]